MEYETVWSGDAETAAIKALQRPGHRMRLGRGETTALVLAALRRFQAQGRSSVSQEDISQALVLNGSVVNGAIYALINDGIVGRTVTDTQFLRRGGHGQQYYLTTGATP